MRLLDLLYMLRQMKSNIQPLSRPSLVKFYGRLCISPPIFPSSLLRMLFRDSDFTATFDRCSFYNRRRNLMLLPDILGVNCWKALHNSTCGTIPACLLFKWKRRTLGISYHFIKYLVTSSKSWKRGASSDPWRSHYSGVLKC